jgi:hypothetical protein
MRHYSAHCVTYHAYRIQGRAFVAGLFASVAFIGFAITSRENAAMACALLACFGYGVAAGSWVVGARFKD